MTMKLSKIAIFAISMSVFSLAQISFADDQVQTRAEVTSNAFPTAVIKRPFTPPQGSLEVSGAMKFGNHTGDAGAVAPDMASLSSLSARFGLTDDLSVGVSWDGFLIPKMNPTKSFTAGLGFFVGANKFAATMVSVDVPVHFNSDAVRNVRFAAPTAFGIAPNVSILAFYDGLVDFRFAGKKYEASFNLPIKVGYQATEKLWVDASTNLATFEVGSQKGHNYIWQKAPVKVRGLYAITNSFDVVADVGFDNVVKPKETFAFTLGLNYRIGVLDA
jgi:hypothetical protein